jgi:hypothetical protein
VNCVSLFTSGNRVLTTVLSQWQQTHLLTQLSSLLLMPRPTYISPSDLCLYNKLGHFWVSGWVSEWMNEWAIIKISIEVIWGQTGTQHHHGTSRDVANGATCNPGSSVMRTREVNVQMQQGLTQCENEGLPHGPCTQIFPSGQGAFTLPLSLPRQKYKTKSTVTM